MCSLGRLRYSEAMAENQRKMAGFHLLAKPVGPLCNLDCTYCFYTEKAELFPAGDDFRMPDAVLEAYIRKNIAEQDVPEVEFAWQGGEPTLAGLDFFRKAIRMEEKYAGGKHISNTLQTNATFLDDEWCVFLARHGFLVGVSLDGPQDIHDLYRKDRKGRPSFNDTMHGIRLLQKHRVEFNILASVTGASSFRPLDVYHFFKTIGAQYIQFIPVVEKYPDVAAQELGMRFGMLEECCGGGAAAPEMTPWSVSPEGYGDFLIAIFDEWVRSDVGRMFVLNFEWALASWVGLSSRTCFFAEHCGQSVVMEHNGDIYSCDHFVYPAYRLGNILTGSPREMVESRRQRDFGVRKSALPSACRECRLLFACRGECPKHRFACATDHDPGRNYLCPSYQRFFIHVEPYMTAIAGLLHKGEPAEKVMELHIS